jgi:hypothetical protein
MVSGAQIMMTGAAVSAMFFWLNAGYYASGRIGLWTRGYGIYTTVVLGLAWWCVQQWGFLGVAGLVTLGKVLFTVVMAIICIAGWRREYDPGESEPRGGRKAPRPGDSSVVDAVTENRL